MVIMERFITTYPVIDKGTKIGKDIEEWKHIINKYELMYIQRFHHTTVRLIFSNTYGSSTKTETFQGHYANPNTFYRKSSI